MKLDATIVLICLGLFAFFCYVAVLAENRKARVRRRARKIFGRIKCRPEAATLDDTTCFNCRRTRWGMDKAAVRASEKEPLTAETEDSLTFTTTAFGKPCRLAYCFDKEALVSLSCYFELNYESPRTYVDTFNTLIKRLMRYYGVPSARDVFWSENAPDAEAFDGAAVAKGWATYIARWKTPYTLVLATLAGTDGNIGMTVKCSSIAYLKSVESIWRP